jgi:hypothetical protein
MTIDGGSTWNDISGTDGGNPLANLPDLPLSSVVIDPGTSPHSIIVASDAGVFGTANLGATWEVLGSGLPTVVCTSLAIDSSATPSLLRVGTYGRSAFELAYDRKYVSLACIPFFEYGTRELPFCTLRHALNAPASGDTEYINIQGGTGFIYNKSPITINQCVTLNAIGGPVTIR